MVAALHDAGRRLPFPIEVIAFGDEEGSRFPAAMLTSRAVAGTLPREALDIADGNGMPLAEAAGRRRRLRSDAAACAPGSALAYLEAHIEQGPVLEAEGLAVGTVTGIAAQRRYRVRVTGTAGHAGTSSMPLRRDALAGAAEMVLAVERIARAERADLVATVGKHGGAARRGQCRARARCASPSTCARAMRRVATGAADAILDAIWRDRRRPRPRLLGRASCSRTCPPAPAIPALMDLLDAAIVGAGQPPRRLVSGAGHDAMIMAALCPTAMLFIRCQGGVSHNPAEQCRSGRRRDRVAASCCGFIDRDVRERVHGA